MCIEALQILRWRVVAAGRVLHRNRQRLAGGAVGGERHVRLDDLDVDLPTDEAQADVRQQRARQQPSLAQHLKAVADPEHEPAAVREARHGLHDRREARDRADAQVVAVGEAARHDDRLDAVQVRSPCHSNWALAPGTRSQARTASTSSHEPGKRMTPNFTATRRARLRGCRASGARAHALSRGHPLLERFRALTRAAG